MERNPNLIKCNDCGSTPDLYETPFGDADYVLECDCESRGIDISECVRGNALLDALSGKWSSLDHDSASIDRRKSEYKSE